MPSPLAPAGARPAALPPSYMPPATRRLIGLEPHDCRWPLGEISADTFGFCSAPRGPRSSYCACHAALSCAPPR